ncbi:MAG TPA: polysaccharide deacetylase family protein [Flavipsychrobacter sp.]|nr:polysaccharide deacetylase family protein [Flavipsychrobacter sp.]
MRSYWVKTPKWLPQLFPKELIWKMPSENEPCVYLTFDDGPHPKATVFVLDLLKEYDVKATFFCIGKNVVRHLEIYERILAEGHTVGNHTQDHLNGWTNDNHAYLSNVLKASKHIQSRNFRPPYGRIKISQTKRLSKGLHPWKIFMWDVLSGDFDTLLSPEQCSQNVIQHVAPGSIVVFHDSEKAFPRMSYALVNLLKLCAEKNWKIKALPHYE